MSKQSISSGKSFFFYDSYERHRKVSELIGNSQTILDVGGQLNALSQFLSGKKVTVANLSGSQEKSEVIIRGEKLPFKNNSFDCVCAIDVLEHIGGKDRQGFIRELLRVTSKKVVLSFPIGTPDHVKYEKGLQEHLAKKGMDVTYLKEHIKFILPSVEQIKKICSGLNYDLYYSGNILINKHLFKLFLFDPKIKIVRKSNYYFKLLLNSLTNKILYTILSNRKYSNKINRAYLVIHKH